MLSVELLKALEKFGTRSVAVALGELSFEAGRLYQGKLHPPEAMEQISSVCLLWAILSPELIPHL